MKLNVIREIREPQEAFKMDEFHINKCKNDEVRLILFTLSKPTIALGKNQNSKVLKECHFKIIKKYTNGTAVYFYNTEIIISIIIGKDVFNNNSSFFVILLTSG